MKWFVFFTIIILLIISFYLGFRTLNLFNLHHNGYFKGLFKQIFWFILVLSSLSFIFVRIIQPISDYWAPLIGNLLFSLIICFLYSAIIVDFIRLFLWWNSKKTDTNLVLQVSYIFLGFSLFGLGLYMAGVPRIANYQIDIHKKANIDKLKIVQLSDIHISETTPYSFVEKMVERVNSFEPDYIFITGDTLDLRLKPFVDNDFAKVFAKLKAKFNTVIIFGNHEHYGIQMELNNDHQAVVNTFKAGNMKVLQDEVFFDKRTGIYIVGRDDYVVKSMGKTRKEISELISLTDTTKPIILLDHQPRNLDDDAQSGVDVVFSGHTHAGQIFPINFLVNFMYKNAWGIYKYSNDKFVSIVSSGYGLWGPPIRLMTRAEIVVVDFNFK